MIGFYDYTVVLTYVSLAISAFGMTQAVSGHFPEAVCCLALSGLCDMFDGKIARRKKNRTDDEKSFGIQIDSLCDVICFGVFPALLCYEMGVRGVLGTIVLAFYVLCGVIRLAYFNVLEGKRQQEEEGATKYYHGLPITSMAIVLPVLFFARVCFLREDGEAFLRLLYLALVVVGLLFVMDFRLRKPNNRELSVIVAVVAVAVVVMLFCTVKYGPAQLNGTPLQTAFFGH